MSEQNTENKEAAQASGDTQTASSGGTPGSAHSSVKLNALFAFKVGMTQVVNDKGEMETCTVLHYEPWVVSQVKTKDNDGYEAVQIACRARKQVRSPKSQQANLKKAGFKTGAYFVREVRDDLPEGVAVGAVIALDSLKKGDWVKATSVSKGKGFAGVMKRWNAGGGPGAHGSCFHRQPGSSGNRTWPGRIMKGKHFPGHLGDETTTVRNLRVVEVFADDNVILLSGPVPGAKEALVRVYKQD